MVSMAPMSALRRPLSRGIERDRSDLLRQGKADESPCEPSVRRDEQDRKDCVAFRESCQGQDADVDNDVVHGPRVDEGDGARRYRNQEAHERSEGL